MRARASVACALAAAGAAASCQAAAGGTSPGTHELPPGSLRLSDTRLQASNRERVTFTVTLTRRSVRDGRLELTLPATWTGRSGVSGLPYARVPATGSASSSRAGVRRSGRVVRFAFTRARRGDVARYTVTDRGIPARAYALAYRWREGGTVRSRGTATVTVFVVPRSAR